MEELNERRITFKGNWIVCEYCGKKIILENERKGKEHLVRIENNFGCFLCDRCFALFDRREKRFWKWIEEEWPLIYEGINEGKSLYWLRNIDGRGKK